MTEAEQQRIAQLAGRAEDFCRCAECIDALIRDMQFLVSLIQRLTQQEA